MATWKTETDRINFLIDRRAFPAVEMLKKSSQQATPANCYDEEQDKLNEYIEKLEAEGEE